MIDFAAIFRHHWADVLRFSLYLCGNAAEAEDLASEAFLRAWASTKPVRQGTVKSYLFVIVRNLYRDRLRRGSRARPLDHSLREPGAGPAETAAGRSELERVLVAMQQLSEADRAVLALGALGSMPHELIAEALGCSVGAVRVRIHRARLKLSIALEQSCGRNEA